MLKMMNCIAYPGLKSNYRCVDTNKEQKSRSGQKVISYVQPKVLRSSQQEVHQVYSELVDSSEARRRVKDSNAPWLCRGTEIRCRIDACLDGP